MTDLEKAKWKEYNRRHYLKHREERLEKCKLYYQEHREELVKYQRDWRKNNPDKCYLYKLKYEMTHPDYKKRKKENEVSETVL